VTKFAVGQMVSVPSARLGLDLPFAMTDREVLAVKNRSVVLNEGESGTKVASRLVTQQIHLRLIRLGDIVSENPLLDPVTKGLDHYFRLLLKPDSFRTWWVRTLPELKAYLDQDPTPTHVIFVGHCDKSIGQMRLATGYGSPNELLGAFAPAPKVFLSLACSSGQANFGRAFSSGVGCGSLVAPFQAIHGAVAVEVGVLMFNNLFLRGESLRDAVRHVNGSLPSKVHLRLWKDGGFETPGSVAVASSSELLNKGLSVG
jgi:hypothetical protein